MPVKPRDLTAIADEVDEEVCLTVTVRPRGYTSETIDEKGYSDEPPEMGELRR